MLRFQPINLKPKSVLIIGLIASTAALFSIFFIDQKIAIYFDATFGSSLDRAGNLVTWLGLGDTYFAIAIFGYLISRFFEFKNWHFKSVHSTRAKKTFSFMFFAFVYSGVLLMSLKMIIGRCRPYKSPNFDAFNFSPLTTDWDFHSFPSGHTQVSFTFATFMAILFPRLSLPLFAIAALVALSRVVLDYHFLGDTIAGAYIGFLGVFLAYKHLGKKYLN